MSSEWQPICDAPKDEIVDIWCGKYHERLTNYKLADLGDGNIFFDPVISGRCAVRTATHFMRIPEPPK